MGRGPSIGGLSVPPSWARAASPRRPTPPRRSWSAPASQRSAAPDTAPVTAVPGGVPSMATAGRGGYGLGAPRYGVKPTVMPKPAI
ncbi:PE/PPE C-terminal domain-containing protein [Mycobacterium avium]|uniref:PE/PPE C-terminal domain-containing protein n=1 Tax=Mycobacterium avium TaxID=1764 RepID=UPI001EDDA0B6|nr:PE/PPE C-terminal domain-containing protein [Mycobacterium avium]